MAPGPLIVALGSSFAAGPGLDPIDDAAARRSAVNFPHLFASQVEGARLVDLTVSGATLLNVLSESQTNGKTTFAPQLEGLTADADVVLITAGGNDMGYIGGLFMDSIPRWLVALLRFVGLVSGTIEDTPTDEVQRRLRSLVDAVRARAPAARIFLVEYLRVLGDHITPRRDVAWDAKRNEYHRAKGAALQRIYEAVADQSSVERVPIDSISADHDIGSEEPWVSAFAWSLFVKGACFHPNHRGMQAVADELVGRYNKTDPRGEKAS